MQAVNNLSIQSGVGPIVNSGLMSSIQNNINVTYPQNLPSTDLNIDLTGGTLEALNGTINVRDENFTGNYNLNVVGGGDIWS